MAFLDWFRSSHKAEDKRSVERRIMDDVDSVELREKLLEIEEGLLIINRNQAEISHAYSLGTSLEYLKREDSTEYNKLKNLLKILDRTRSLLAEVLRANLALLPVSISGYFKLAKIRLDQQYGLISGQRASKLQKVKRARPRPVA